MLFRLLAPPFGLFFEIVPKFHLPNHVYSLRFWLLESRRIAVNIALSFTMKQA
jgi:hypothetical protein